MHTDLKSVIIENSTYVEKLASNILAAILNIDWQKTESFGEGPSSLTFNQKIQIILDIKGLNEADSKKLAALMNISNKFTTDSEIKTFGDFFSKTKEGQQIKNDFKDWYLERVEICDKKQVNCEKIYCEYFYLLLEDVEEILRKILGDHIESLDEPVRQQFIEERLKHNVLEYFRKLYEGRQASLEFLNSL